jgi:hypothetical protein
LSLFLYCSGEFYLIISYATLRVKTYYKNIKPSNRKNYTLATEFDNIQFTIMLPMKIIELLLGMVLMLCTIAEGGFICIGDCTWWQYLLMAISCVLLLLILMPFLYCCCYEGAGRCFLWKQWQLKLANMMNIVVYKKVFLSSYILHFFVC